jgi:hypothetical protein
MPQTTAKTCNASARVLQGNPATVGAPLGHGAYNNPPNPIAPQAGSAAMTPSEFGGFTTAQLKPYALGISGYFPGKGVSFQGVTDVNGAGHTPLGFWPYEILLESPVAIARRGNSGGGPQKPQSQTSTCVINNGHVTGVATGAGQAPGAGAFGFVPPAGSVAIDPLSLGLFPGAQTNALLGPNASQITFSFSPAPNVPSGFPTTYTLGSILDPKARVGGVYFHGQYGFDIFGFSSVAAADAVTETGQVTITYPSSLQGINCGGPIADPVPLNPGLASNQQNTNGALSAYQNVHFQHRPSSPSHHAPRLGRASLWAQARGNR